MSVLRRAARMLILLALASPAAADESGRFVVRLGQDTTSVESYTRSGSRLEVTQVGRAPRVLRRHVVVDLESGAMTRFSLVVKPPGSDTATQTVEARFDGDSLRTDVRNGANPPSRTSVALAPGSLLMASASPWSAYEMAVQRLLASRADTLGGRMILIGAANSERYLIRKLGRDSVEISNTRGDVYRARVDKAGHILGTRPIAGTQKFSVTRVASLDLEALAASFAARDKAGSGMGVLSPRDTVRVNAAGATLMIDYGRPAKRGRVIFGDVVPYGEVWRTGANAATQIRTDKALDFGGSVLPAGFYTLWTLPTASGWKLIVNSETGEWGTAHKAEKDVLTLDMKISTLPQVVERFTISVEPNDSGGVLDLDWDTTRASIAFTVKPN